MQATCLSTKQKRTFMNYSNYVGQQWISKWESTGNKALSLVFALFSSKVDNRLSTVYSISARPNQTTELLEWIMIQGIKRADSMVEVKKGCNGGMFLGRRKTQIGLRLVSNIGSLIGCRKHIGHIIQLMLVSIINLIIIHKVIINHEGIICI